MPNEHLRNLNAKPLTLTTPLSPSPPPLEPRIGTGDRSITRIKILVAEDDAVSREIICVRLEQWGYDVLEARNGSEAMTELRKPGAPTLAILDWMMPGMDGLEICRRTREVNRTLYAIMLTARAGTENLVEALNAGADAFLVKPVNKDELRAQILTGLRVMNSQLASSSRSRALEELISATVQRQSDVPL